ncbi:MAG: bifunctional riboflavin kinase/FAD synthetase [Paludibacteraceae bacterium]|nr:bifunctional riboflavin kinase/FAD synthetase [Paludibacteraceae bacterium]
MTSVIDIFNSKIERPLALTIGFFDGVHLGHRYLVSELSEIAKKRNFASAVLTFRTHPRQVLHSDYIPSLLTTADEKIALLKETGVDYVVMTEFTREFSMLTAQDFMRLLHDNLNVCCLMIGYDHRFGHNRSEKFEDYVRFGNEIGIEVVQSSPLVIDGINVSSSAVRKTISEGDVAKAAKLLGREYSLAGQVVKGFQVGRTIGFPTANISYDDSRILPKDGVYAARVAVDSHLYDAMLYIGSRPTVNTGKISVEAYLFDFSDDIYGKNVNVRFVDRIRDSIKFDSIEELKKQLGKDEIKAKLLTANSL